MNFNSIKYAFYIITFGFLISYSVYEYKIEESQIDLSSTASVPKPFSYDSGVAFSLIKDPDILIRLEKKGFSLSGILNSIKDEKLNYESAVETNLNLYNKNKLYQSAIDVISKDLKDILVDENKSNPGAVGVGMAFSRRIFDDRWLKANSGFFELIGVVNRTDRMSFEPKTCGEIRLVYRLAYNVTRPSKMYSRLPMTLVVKFNQAQQNNDWKTCHRFVDNWIYPNQNLNEDQFADWAVSENGPLSSQLLDINHFKSLEINMQALRVPATIRRDMGGHAAYLLRAFKKENENLIPELLENSIDVEKLSQNEKLKNQLLRFLKKDFHRLDAGILHIPDDYLAKRAISYSPYGVSRYSNKPYHQLFKESDFSDLNYSRNQFVKTPDALLRRLNDYSCVGCHQGRATAGFHLLGVDRRSTHPMNALQFEGSGHMQTELVRREEFMDRLHRHLVPNPYRDFSIAPPLNKKAGYGHFCGLSNSKGFEHWQCEEGLICTQSDEAKEEKVLGKCLPKISKSGDPCMFGYVTQEDRNKDKIILQPDKKCNPGVGSYKCSPVVGPVGSKLGGFPSGMCQSNSCSGLDSTTEICGKIAAKGFSECIADGSKTFGQCLDSVSQDVGLGLCDKNRACRNDCVCVRVSEGKGACMPSYFVFQVRHDGHPTPQ